MYTCRQKPAKLLYMIEKKHTKLIDLISPSPLPRVAPAKLTVAAAPIIGSQHVCLQPQYQSQ